MTPPRIARPSFYVLGGTLTRDAPSYVMRDADLDLHAALVRGEFCYVLTSRQMGKSSLMVRMVVRLRAEGTKAAVVDLTALGQNLTPEQWYLGLLGRIGAQLNLEDVVEDYWDAHAVLGPLQRFLGGIREAVLGQTDKPVVIFIDEIDATRSLPFSADEFFAGIRELYNERSEVADLGRLTFCLLGVATPSDLIQDTRTTPFNIGHRIELTDFSAGEAQVLLPGLSRTGNVAPALLRRILHWTGGHPYLTQRMCQAAAEDGRVKTQAGIDHVCDQLFLSNKARDRDDNLLFVRDRMLRGGSDPVELLTIYSSIRTGKLVQDDPASPILNQLRLAGVVRSDNGYLRVRNRIYERVFDQKWVEANQPMDEVQRQRAAERRGRWKVLAWAVPLVALFAGLAFLAWWQSHKAQELSESMRQIADSGLEATSAVANEIYAASSNRPELRGIYTKIVQATSPFLETMLKIEPNNPSAATLKANGLYVAADDAIRKGDKTLARTKSQESLKLADQLKASTDIRMRAIAARLYATAAESFSKIGDSTEAGSASQQGETLARDVSRQMKPDDEFTIQSLSMAYDMLGAAEEGLDHWDRAVQLYQHNVGMQQKVSNLYLQKGGDARIFQVVHDALEERNRIAQIQFDNLQYDAARKVLEERSLAIANTLVQWNENPQRHRNDAQKRQAIADLWDVERQLSLVLAQQKNTWSDALRYASQAVDTAEKLVQAEANSTNHRKLESSVAALAKIQNLLGISEDAMHAWVRYVALVHERASAQPSPESAATLGSAYRQLASFEAHHGSKSAAPADYQNALEWLAKGNSRDVSVQREIATASLNLAYVEADFGQTDQSKQHYRQAAGASERCIALDGSGGTAADAPTHVALASDYQNLAFSKLGLGDRNGTAETLTKMLGAAKTAVNAVQAPIRQRRTPQALASAAVAYGTLGWAELLSGHAQESIQASQEALQLDKQPWIYANLAHAYLLANQLDEARSIYLAHRGEEMYDEPFELAVLDDLSQLRKLGFNRPAMAVMEKLIGN